MLASGDALAQDDAAPPPDEGAPPGAGDLQPGSDTTPDTPDTPPGLDGKTPDEAEQVAIPTFEADTSEHLDLILSVVSATKIVQRTSEAPSIISVFSREEMGRYGWMSLNDILYKQPGFVPAKDYDRPTVAGRGGFEGWNNNHLLLLVDGVPFNDNLYGTALTWEVTPLSLANIVEISRGPGSALYGTNATNGVISITTVSPIHLGSFAEANVRLGNRNTQVYDFIASNVWKSIGVVLGYNSHRTRGNEYLSYDGSGRLDPAGNLDTFEVRDSRHSDYFFAKFEGTKELKGLSMQFHNQAWNFETGHGWLWWIPDFREAMQESRQIVSAKYEKNGVIDQEYVLRYQRHNIDWNMRYYPNGAFDGYYPAGTTEYLNTFGQDLFARAQLSKRVRKDGNVLVGAEYTGFLYTGDNSHYTNTGLTDVAGGYPPLAGNEALGSWFEWVEDKPVNNLGLYGQFVTGGMWKNRLNLTVGVRYDRQFFNYVDIADAARPTKSKHFQQISPRAGLVIAPVKDLTFKLLAGRAFRAPAPSELFGANTFTLASNLAELKPEIMTTYEAASDWQISKKLVWRVNAFYKNFENQIAYSVANANLSTNVYSHEAVGGETEVAVTAPLRREGNLRGFANYSFVKLLDETIQDATIVENEDLTWSPAHSINFGASLRYRKFEGSVQGHFQGPVERRSSDRVIAAFQAARPEKVGAWVTFDARFAYRPTSWSQVGVQATNFTNSNGKLVKNNDYPFDYRIDPRLVMGTLDLELR